MNIHIYTTLSQPGREILEKMALPGEQWTWRTGTDNEAEERQAAEATIIFGNPPLSVINAATGLKWLQLISAGIDPYQHLDPQVLDRTIVTNLKGFFARPVMESIMAAILAWYRKIPALIRYQQAQQWIGESLRPEMDLLDGKKVLILGSGAIGERLHTVLTAFGCQVQVIDTRSSPGLPGIEAVLPVQDIVIGCLPDTPATRGIFNLQRLSKMKATAMLVNAGRGSLVVEADLIYALRNGILGCAILDVTEQEPVGADTPLWSLPNVILTQHTAGGYREERTDKVRLFADNLHRFRAGQPLLHPVNFRKGY